MKAYPLVQVTWEDSGANAEWLSAERLTYFENHPFEARTAGYLIRDTKACLVIASSISSEEDFGGCWRIPRAMVKRVRRLR